MKPLLTFLSLLIFLLFNKSFAHSVQLAYCVDANGNFQLFVEHWHNAENPSGTNMTIQFIVGGITTTSVGSPSGSYQNVPIGSLPGCASAMTVFGSCPGDANQHNDWIQYSFNSVPCGTSMQLRVISGNTQFTEDCGSMFPASTGTITLPCPISPITVNDQSVCQGNAFAAINFPTQSNVIYNWTNDNTAIGLAASGSGNIPSFMPTPSGTDIVSNITVSYYSTLDPANILTETFTLTAYANPISNAGTDETTTCIVPNVNLSGSGGGNYSWSPTAGLSNSTIASPLADPTSTTTYTLTVTNPSNGCFDSDQVTVTVDETDPVANAGPDLLIDCAATSGSLTGTGGVSYLWNTPSGIVTGSSLSLTGADQPGLYTLTATAANGCTNSDDALVTIDQVLPLSTAGPDLISNCTTPDVTLDGIGSSSGPGITYSWTGPSFTNVTDSIVTSSNMAGTYFLTVTAPNSCTQIDSTIIVVDTIYPIANAGIDQTLDCNNTSVTLDGSTSDIAANIIYSWSTINGNITTDTTLNTIDADLDGSYTITVTNTTNGCITSGDVDISQDTVTPIAIITSSSLTLDCNYPSGNIDASTSTGIGNTYLWSTTNGNISNGANTPTPTVDLDGTYNLTITSANGCVNLNPIAETVLIDTVSPTISINIADTLTCNILEITLDASASQSGVTYQWTTSNGSIESGDQTSTPIIGLNGVYDLNIIAPNGCSSNASVTVVNSEAPIANMVVDPLEGFQPLYVTFTDSSSGVGLEYSWDFGNGDYDDSQNTDYTYIEFGEFESILTVTDQYGCSDYDTTIITVFELSEVIVPNIFSPNGDGVNDVFIISGGGIKNLNAQIINRWGQIIYEWDTAFGSWDGHSFAGEESASGSYFYFIDVEYNNGNAEEFKGNVVLVR